jgi:cyclophilin family peptidyl-prolyl cis-trans isomerase
MKSIRLLVLAGILLTVTTGCTKRGDFKVPTGPSPTLNLTSKERVELALTIKDKQVKLNNREYAVIETNKGTFTAKLFSNQAPNTVKNFIRLAEAGFYDGLTWHRYVGGFLVQGGDPVGTGMGNAGYKIDYEESGKKHVKGSVGMARGPARNSASCQFYITLDIYPDLDGKYCVFGEVIDNGMKVIMQLRNAIDSLDIPPDTIRRITIVRSRRDQ